MKAYHCLKIYIIVIFLTFFTILYMIVMVLAPDKLDKVLFEDYNEKKGGSYMEDIYLNDPVLFDLSLEKAFFESKLEVSETNNITLDINLKDSTCYLVINGVHLLTSKIINYKTSHFFSAIDPQTFVNILSGPMEVESYYGSFVKEPVYYVKAPKDTIEAAQRFFSPDTSDVIPAFVHFELTSHFSIRILQDETRSLRDFAGRRLFILKEKFIETANNVNEMIKFHVPDYSPHITITLPRQDIINIYRALPENAQVSIRYYNGSVNKCQKPLPASRGMQLHSRYVPV